MNDLFLNLSPREKDKLLKFFESTYFTFKKNQSILESLKDNTLILIIEGEIQISYIDYNGNITVTDEYRENDLFAPNLSFVINDETIVYTKQDTKLLIIDYNAITRTNTNYPFYNTFLQNLISVTNNLLKEKNNHIQILSKKTIRDKLLEYFKINSTKGTRVLYLPFSYTELANYLGVNRSAMARELSNLRQEGLVETKGRRFTLKY